jgi:hypothetical protein
MTPALQQTDTLRASIFTAQQEQYYPKLHRIFSFLLALEAVVAVGITLFWTSGTWVAVELPNCVDLENRFKTHR